jgi:hypothetical protein
MLVVDCEEPFKEDIRMGPLNFLTLVSLEPPFMPWFIQTISYMRSKDPSEQAQRYPKQVPAYTIESHE